MNFDFSAEQKQLKEEARRLLLRECPRERVRAVLDDPRMKYDVDLWKTLATQGWTGPTIPASNPSKGGATIATS